MQFYSLGYSTGPETGKTFPQSQKVHDNMPGTAAHHIKNQRAGSIWPENTYLPSPILDRKAKKTDRISCSSEYSGRLVMSDKMKQVLQRFRQTGFQFFKIQLINPLPGNKLHNLAFVTNSYWVMNFYETDYKYVDFPRSEVNLLGLGTTKIKSLDIKSVWDFNKAEKELTTIWIDKMVLSEDIREHILHIPRVNNGAYLVSQYLKEALEEAACTGIDFKPLELPVGEQK
jgi:hypothetical protein